jgi:hypothetical protein
LFEVREAQASTTPQKAVLVFNHYGNRYFLSKLFDGADTVGIVVVDSGYSKKYTPGEASVEEKDVPASRPEIRAN